MINAAINIVIIKGITASLVANPTKIRMEQPTSANTANASDAVAPTPRGSGN